MADDTTFQSATLATPPAGTIVSADAATGSGALVQRMKLAYSADGSITHVTADADGVLVNLGANNDVTVSGTVAATQSGSWSVSVTGTVAISASALPLPSGAATAAKQPALGAAGTPSSDVISVQGVSGGTALPVSDGGGALTVDGTVSISGSVTVTGTVAATQSGTWTVTGAGGTFPVTDSGGSLTVDAPVGTPVYVRLSDGASAISTLPVSLASVPSHAVTNAGTFAVQAASAGDVAHDSADSGAPVKIGAKAASAEPTAVTAADRVNLLADLVGRLITAPALPELLVDGTGSATNTSDTAVIAAQGSGVRIYVTTITVSNSSATATEVVIKSGSTARMTIPAPATGGAVITLPSPLRLGDNEALNFASAASVTTMKVSAAGYKGR